MQPLEAMRLPVLFLDTPRETLRTIWNEGCDFFVNCIYIYILKPFWALSACLLSLKRLLPCLPTVYLHRATSICLPVCTPLQLFLYRQVYANDTTTLDERYRRALVKSTRYECQIVLLKVMNNKDLDPVHRINGSSGLRLVVLIRLVILHERFLWSKIPSIHI